VTSSSSTERARLNVRGIGPPSKRGRVELKVLSSERKKKRKREKGQSPQSNLRVLESRTYRSPLRREERHCEEMRPRRSE